MVVADPLKLALLQLTAVHVGLNPQQPAGAKADAIRAAEHIALDIAFGFRAWIGRVTGQQQMVPLELQAVEVARILPTDDLAHGVVGTWVGRVHARFARFAALAVVGERAIHPATGRVDGQPFRAVHFGGAQGIAGLTRFDEYLALISKTIGGCQGSLAMHQGQPSAGAIGLKPRHIQGAVV